ncbi:phosphotransferase [Streptomyces sp. NPDC050164]|uniref:phosphotransferase n=1 Tax=Streptomyces sp. NPDC050164 TaxID=3365605 RepID=UPI0037A68306
MMPLTEIDRLKQTVSEAWDSPIADQVAARWGYPAGTAKWWRSSASHVFVLPDRGRRRYLRFVPSSYRGRQWGEALARMHRDATGLDAGLPESFGDLPDIGELFADDAELVEAAVRLADVMRELPRCQDGWGVVHGDFELDNMAWEEGGPIAYDFDEAALSWYAADIAYAVRDLTDMARTHRQLVIDIGQEVGRGIR